MVSQESMQSLYLASRTLKLLLLGSLTVLIATCCASGRLDYGRGVNQYDKNSLPTGVWVMKGFSCNGPVWKESYMPKYEVQTVFTEAIVTFRRGIPHGKALFINGLDDHCVIIQEGQYHKGVPIGTWRTTKRNQKTGESSATKVSYESGKPQYKNNNHGFGLSGYRGCDCDGQ